MIIVDMNQISLANVMMHLSMNKLTVPDIGLVRHMILNSLRQYRSQFSQEFGEMVIAYDSKHYWRRDYFPNYKANRKKGRETDSKDWDAIFECLNEIKQEIREHLPYKVLEVHGAEADDIIAVLVEENPKEKILILSGDKDFIQLQTQENVSQYSPITKKMVNGEDPVEYKRIHILKGDSSDGIPNVLSSDDTFVTGIRQKPLSAKKIDEMRFSKFPSIEVERNFQRNRTLIDLGRIPNEIKDRIKEQFTEAPCGDRSKLFNFFVKNKLRELTENIGDF